MYAHMLVLLFGQCCGKGCIGARQLSSSCVLCHSVVLVVLSCYTCCMHCFKTFVIVQTFVIHLLLYLKHLLHIVATYILHMYCT
jgi:hypothetical protein